MSQAIVSGGSRRWGILARGADGVFLAALGVIGGFYVLLIVSLVVADGWFLYKNTNQTSGGLVETVFGPFLLVVQSKDIQFALWLSLISCFIAAVLSVLVAIPLGYVMSRYRFWGKGLVDAVLDVPIVLPPLVIGLSLLIFFNQTPPGKWMEAKSEVWLGWLLTWVGTPLVAAIAAGVLLRLVCRNLELGLGGKLGILWGIPLLVAVGTAFIIRLFPGEEPGTVVLGEFFGRHTRGITYAVPSVIIAQFAVACAFSVRTMRVAFDQISPRSEQVAMTLGCTRGQAFRRVVLPEAWRGVVTAGTLAWARSLGEFGPILIFSGATRQRTEVLSTTVFLELSVGNINAAVAISLLMIGVALVVLMLVRLVGATPFQRGI